MQVLFFARLREELNTPGIVINEAVNNVGQLREILQKKGPRWQSLLDSEQSLVAVNQTLADDTQVLKSGDEVAFFPPVTGG